MQSRTDQVHSYQFFLQRVVSALVTRESDPADLPFRRLGWAGLGSVMVAVLVAAGFGVYGILVGGGATSWRDGTAVVVEKGTGTAYLYREERLFPMANLVSAQVALGADAVVRVSARSLRGVPRGPLLGIPDAPAGLPDEGSLLTGGWAMCTEAVPDNRGGRVERSVLGVGQPAAGGQPLTDQQALLVRDVSGGAPDLHLVWRGHRFALAVQERALPVLGLGRERAVPVAPAWLDALPLGDPIRPPPGDPPGSPTTAIENLREDLGLRTGQVLAAAGSFYLVRVAELREITALQKDLVLAGSGAEAAYPDGPPQVREVEPAALANALIEDLPEPALTSPPEAMPALLELAPGDGPAAPVCTGFEPGRFPPAVVAGGRLPGWTEAAIRTPGRTADGHLLADHVLVEGGTAALVQSTPSPEAPGGALSVVTDAGLRYPLSSPEVAGFLGYRLDKLVRLPAGVVDRLPAGPVLDPATARAPIPASGSAG